MCVSDLFKRRLDLLEKTYNCVVKVCLSTTLTRRMSLFVFDLSLFLFCFFLKYNLFFSLWLHVSTGVRIYGVIGHIGGDRMMFEGAGEKS